MVEVVIGTLKSVRLAMASLCRGPGEGEGNSDSDKGRGVRKGADRQQERRNAGAVDAKAGPRTQLSNLK
ncbi:uncharacterized protein BDZ83DRAFT_596872 [Colletotrichum acutatum]|uniref:Uncharacterized protein n=1 Tax=Glomerella acutata TaxID=27357 RepID=A0AAD9D2Y1_GLOAC|nr:uncharacterized protein BDZ83DRAFT_596872 [Colletotrichum acutatum]KAK1731827.1 hypothetical protein BDZ83DRAFT_596872 [Colletotrichum acutatum]